MRFENYENLYEDESLHQLIVHKWLDGRVVHQCRPTDDHSISYRILFIFFTLFIRFVRTESELNVRNIMFMKRW